MTPEELLKYAYLRLDQNGLPPDWCEALLDALEAALDAADDLK